MNHRTIDPDCKHYQYFRDTINKVTKNSTVDIAFQEPSERERSLRFKARNVPRSVSPASSSRRKSPSKGDLQSAGSRYLDLEKDSYANRHRLSHEEPAPSQKQLRSATREEPEEGVKDYAHLRSNHDLAI